MKIREKSIIAFFISFFVFMVEVIKISDIENFNSLFSQLKFKLRGQSQIDTSITFIYIDDNTIHSLGGYPLKRSYYATLIDLLTQLNVKAIAFDILLIEKNPDYPERDFLLVSTVKNSNRVYLGGTFINLEKTNKKSTVQAKAIEKFLINIQDENTNFIKGSDFIGPFDELLQSCAGLGHLNYVQKGFPTAIPLLVHISEERFLPSLSLELARVYYNVPRESIKVYSNQIYLGQVKIPTNNGKMQINYIGGFESLKMYSLIDFVRLYDAVKSGLEPETKLNDFKDKIVFVGIFSETLGHTVNSPFQEKFPPTGIHIMALNTIIQKKFLIETTPLLNLTLSFLFSFLILHFVTYKSLSKAYKLLLFPLIAVLVFLLLAVISFAINISIPIYPAFAILFSSLFCVIYTVEVERKKAIEIESKKKEIEKMIKEKELKIIELQHELESLRATEDQSNLILNLEKTYDEVRELSSEFEDFSDFSIEENIAIELEGIVYTKGGKMEELISIVKKVAPSDAPVLITGESGTGKELIAMAIHKLSDRKDKKFVTINCSAVPETLLESELFGYEKGAFTGATQRKKGLFEVADEGTIFLDEIAETNLSFQTKILRILQSGEFNRVGGTEIIKTNVRIIAATNRDIEKAVREGIFREDLYYRLNVVRIHLPPLRERKEDIPFLVEHFLRKFKSADIKVSHAVMSALLNYEWPGNIRQLENAIKRATIFAKSDGRKLIQLKDLPEEIAKSVKGKIDIEEKILVLLRKKNFSYSSISETANELGLNRGTVGEYLRGICFKNLYECKFDITKASLKIANGDPDTSEKVKKKLIEHVKNLIENIANSRSEDEIKLIIRQKYKNLPLRYHPYLEEFAIRFQKGELPLEKFNPNDGNI